MGRLFAVVVCSFAATASGQDIPADWAFKPIQRPQPPAVRPPVASSIDAFIRRKQEAVGLAPSSAADRVTLLRRVTFDLIGLPPTPAEIDAFLNDDSPRAYERVVDRLLASPAYGERQAQPWLDVSRFAETDGFKSDDGRPTAWRYRDYVIRSFNADKPFDRFVREQVAGDELFPDDPDALVATAFLRHYPDEYNAINLEQRRQEILNDVADTTAQAFLGITLGCARCHDHKFDPVTQEDYYRFQAFFAGWKEAERPVLPAGRRAEFEKQLKEWEDKTAEVRRQLAELERPYRERFAKNRRGRFPVEYSRLLDVPPEKRTPLEEQLAYMVSKQVYADDRGMFNSMKPEEKERYEGLKKRLAEAGPRPTAAATTMAFTDVGPAVPPTYFLKRGNWRARGDEVTPGYLSAIVRREAVEARVVPAEKTSGRRTALANWLADAKNPLTARTIVNRVWQQHFGRGIVASVGDLGSQGERPTHPELLDWLANDFVEHGWSLKRLHREIVRTEAYRQVSAPDAAKTAIDPENKLLWRMNRRRLDGEELRDGILAVAGALNPKTGGPSVFPELPPEVKSGAWPLTADANERNRRSVYVYVKRNLRYPLFAAFDAPDRCETCSRRFETTTAPQALMLLNDKLYANLARQFATRAQREGGTDAEAVVERAYRIALGRLPTSEERATARAFLGRGGNEAVADFCHALLNLNEFVYLD